MKNISNVIMKYKKIILTVFLIGMIASVFATKYVKVNYNMMDYLPANAKSTTSLEIMNKEYDTKVENLRIVLKNVSIPEVLRYKEEIKSIEGVEEVTWLDDTVASNVPIEMLDQDTVASWYQDENALLSVVVEEEKQRIAIEKIREVIGEENLLSGDTYNTVSAEKSTSAEISNIMIWVVLIIFAILLITTNSWFEPILFLGTIGIAIILNTGTNALLGEISFVTNAAASILQLAVSMDYSIFLLHRFAEERETFETVEEAMKSAMKKSCGSILSSGLTTVVGFAALILMKFKIGPDMGIVMTKAIVLSLLCVLVLLPILAVYSYRLIDKTKHPKLVPPFNKFANASQKVKVISMIFFILLLIPCNLASNKINFSYGSSEIFGDEKTQVGREKIETEKLFGKSNQIVIMVPRGNFAKERQLVDTLKEMPEVKSVTAYVTMVGSEIPVEYVPEEKRSSLLSENYSRMLINIDRPVQGKETFQTVEKLREIVNRYYADTHQMCGESVNTYDMKETVIQDNKVVNAVAIIAIGLILLLNFKSFSLPLILLAVIELSIWINLSFPYFSGETLNYISYLIISSIQLGATIDYAILFTDRYLENRKNYDKKQASIQTIKDTALSIFTSAGILTIAGFLLGNKSSNQVISELGILVGRGAIISLILVFFVLPGLLNTFDKLIKKTTKQVNFK